MDISERSASEKSKSKFVYYMHYFTPSSTAFFIR